MLSINCSPQLTPHCPAVTQIVTKCEQHIQGLQQQHIAEMSQRDYILQRCKDTIMNLEARVAELTGAGPQDPSRPPLPSLNMGLQSFSLNGGPSFSSLPDASASSAALFSNTSFGGPAAASGLSRPAGSGLVQVPSSYGPQVGTIPADKLPGYLASAVSVPSAGNSPGGSRAGTPAGPGLSNLSRGNAPRASPLSTAFPSGLGSASLF